MQPHCLPSLDCRAKMDGQDTMVLMESRGHPDHKAPQDPLDHKAPQDPPDHKATQDPPVHCITQKDNS